MGAGIAQLACLGGYEARLHDPDPNALDQSLARVAEALAGGVDRGRWSAAEGETARGRLAAAAQLDALAASDLVIEAAPEDLKLKRELFAKLEGICGPDAILATNTSSLSVTAIAAAVAHPERVVGMHFFNPPAAMRLVEIVAGDESAEGALLAATEAAEAMGRTPIRASDTVGFVANRCARPYTLESLRMLEEGVAGPAEIDRICRLGGGFRMGPFELMDLIGVDVNLAVARSFYEQSGGEPRWRPSPVQERMVAEGRLGRKSGRGFYDYSSESERREPDAEVEVERPVLEGPVLESLAGPEAPTVLGRIAAQIANEAAFALQEQVASASDMNTATRLGLGWPAGPLEFAGLLGSARAVAILDDLAATRGNAYRVAPRLRESALGGRPLAGP